MSDSSAASCQTCFRPRFETAAAAQDETAATASSLQTQWISFCRCDRPYSPNSQVSIDVCASCRRRIAALARDRVLRLDLCSCQTPNPRKIASQVKANEAESVTLELSSVKLPPDCFPSDKFTPIAVLGDSARALVLLCRDRARGNKVAVKLFKGIRPAHFATFESEVRRNKQLSHTNIARIIEAGIQNGKIPYLVTDYKDGFSLEQCISLYGLPSYDVAVNILLGVCQTLNYAQKQGIFHRDIRPGNIIFLDDMNSEPSVCLTDFALPKVKASEESQDPWFALFMSADEARGLEYSARSEVYTVGCVGYFLLTGRPPFIDGAANDIKNSHALKLPPRISSLNFSAGRPSELDEIVEKCLEKDPRNRFESVEKLQERLEVFPRRVQMRIAEAIARRKRAKLLRIAVVVLVLAALGAAGFFAILQH